MPPAYSPFGALQLALLAASTQKHSADTPFLSSQEYTPDLHRISKKGTKGAVSGTGDVTLTSVKGPPNHTSPATSKASDNNRHSAIRYGSSTKEQPVRLTGVGCILWTYYSPLFSCLPFFSILDLPLMLH